MNQDQSIRNNVNSFTDDASETDFPYSVLQQNKMICFV